MTSVTPFLWFDRQAQPAAEFYADLLEGARVTDVTPYPPGSPHREGEVMTVTLELGGRSYVFLNGGPEFPQTMAFSLMVECVDQAEVDRVWDAFSEGGEPSMCGWITDRFGVTWQVVPKGMRDLLGDPDPERARRAMQAMLGMRKLDLAAMKAAADGS